MFSILTRKKGFGDPWVGHPTLNRRFHLHQSRMRVAEALCRFRRRLIPASAAGLPPRALQSLRRNGCLKVHDWLPPERFEVVRQEVEAAVSAAASTHRYPRNQKEGYQHRRPFHGGFDRFDGGTLNRFLSIDASSMPETAQVGRDSRLTALCRTILGLPMKPQQLEIYLTVQGKEDRTPDLQKELHRDTFFRALKFWYFLRPVRPEDGPLIYVPESHKLDRARLAWEQSTADHTCITRTMPNRSGSFRLKESDFADLALAKPVDFTCPANTLVIADVLGFHRRGDARPGSQRLALYGWLRPYPFLPVSW